MNGRPRPGKCQKTKNERTNKSCMSLTAAGVLFVGGHCVIFPRLLRRHGQPVAVSPVVFTESTHSKPEAAHSQHSKPACFEGRGRKNDGEEGEGWGGRTPHRRCFAWGVPSVHAAVTGT